MLDVESLISSLIIPPFAVLHGSSTTSLKSRGRYQCYCAHAEPLRCLMLKIMQKAACNHIVCKPSTHLKV